MKLKMTPTSWRAHISAVVMHLLEAQVLLQPIEHLLRSRLDADHHAPQAGADARGEQRLAHAARLIGAQRRRPGDVELAVAGTRPPDASMRAGCVKNVSS